MRKTIHIFLSLLIVYASTTSAYANTSIGGWSAVDVITAGATNTINATKTAGGKVLNSAITIAPQAGKVGKYLLRGGAVGALALAVPQILGEGVDWVLDPANNSVKYTVANTSDGSGYSYNVQGKGVASSANEACMIYYNSLSDAFKHTHVSVTEPVAAGAGIFYCNYDFDLWGTPTRRNVGGSRTGSPPTEEEKYLPIDTVAAQVISNAEAGDSSSQEAVKSTALEGFAAGEHDAALEAAATETGTDNPPDTTNPNPDAPAEPFDPAGIISAIKSLKALLAGILSAITGLSDLFNDTPSSPENTDVPVDDLPPTKGASDFDVNYINFGGQCPVLPSFDVGIGGASSALTFDMTPLCDMAVKIRPAVIAIAYFIGLGVIASAIRET